MLRASMLRTELLLCGPLLVAAATLEVSGSTATVAFQEQTSNDVVSEIVSTPGTPLAVKVANSTGSEPQPVLTIETTGAITCSANVLTNDLLVNGVSFSSLLARVAALEAMIPPPSPPATPPAPPPLVPSPPPTVLALHNGAYRYSDGTHASSCAAYASPPTGYPAATSTAGATAAYHVGPPGSPYATACLFNVESVAAWTLVWRTGSYESVRAPNYYSGAVTDAEFRWAGSAWTTGRGSPDGTSSFVSKAWTEFLNPTKLLFTDVASGYARVQWKVDGLTSCVANTATATLSQASGQCAAGGTLGPLTPYSWMASPSVTLKLNSAWTVANCQVNSRVAWDVDAWDYRGGSTGYDSAVLNGVGYDYKTANNYGTGCDCPYSSYCGGELANVGDEHSMAMWVA